MDSADLKNNQDTQKPKQYPQPLGAVMQRLYSAVPVAYLNY
ncbi:hypothetical protein [Xenorhabdus koppenhoeferi]|nr:hypothetical protein [Xenorhabdus sp. Vera]